MNNYDLYSHSANQIYLVIRILQVLQPCNTTNNPWHCQLKHQILTKNWQNVTRRANIPNKRRRRAVTPGPITALERHRQNRTTTTFPPPPKRFPRRRQAYNRKESVALAYTSFNCS
jgi:hypothetical protein